MVVGSRTIIQITSKHLAHTVLLISTMMVAGAASYLQKRLYNCLNVLSVRIGESRNTSARINFLIKIRSSAMIALPLFLWKWNSSLLGREFMILHLFYSHFRRCDVSHLSPVKIAISSIDNNRQPTPQVKAGKKIKDNCYIFSERLIVRKFRLQT